MLSGVVCVLILMGAINLLNLILEWHPLNLDPPFSASQSFEVSYEPYEWRTEDPGTYGYSYEMLSDYFDKLDTWERLRGLVVVKDDKMIIERYFSGSTKYSAFNVHSSEEDLILPFFSEYQNNLVGDFKRTLTIKHLLSMRGGWAGGDGNQTVEACMTREYLHVPPDTEFKYFTGSQNILSAVITKSTKQSTKEFADQYLFKPLRIENGFWRKDGGYYCGGDESYYTARDLARFGGLLLNKGNVDGKQLLDSTWVDKTLSNYTSSGKEFRSLDSYDEVGYGFCWWILKTKDNRTIYTARGKGGQHIVLIPDKNIVVVVLQEWNPFKKNETLENKLLGELLGIL
jgi:hypothetical protein